MVLTGSHAANMMISQKMIYSCRLIYFIESQTELVEHAESPNMNLGFDPAFTIRPSAVLIHTSLNEDLSARRSGPAGDSFIMFSVSVSLPVVLIYLWIRR